MLYLHPRPVNPPEPPLHYFDSAELLLRLRTQGRTLAESAAMAGLSAPQAERRLLLLNLDEGLRSYLRRENVPEGIALTLLKLPDAVTRRRLARRITQERLCIRDAGLLVGAAQRRLPRQEPRQRVITVMRDVRPYRNAIRDIAEQMKTAGVRATFSERKSGGMLELTVAYPARRRRTERYQSM